MSEPSKQASSEAKPLPPARWASPERPDEDPARTLTYDANLQLILRRLADEQRTARVRKWWRSNA
jgi:hypothetical protein